MNDALIGERTLAERKGQQIPSTPQDTRYKANIEQSTSCRLLKIHALE